MPEAHYPEIRALNLFAEMVEANFLSLMRGAYVQNFPPQIELIGEGEPSDFLHVVLSGSVDLFSTWNGRDTSLATVRPDLDLHSGGNHQECALSDVGPNAGEKPDRPDPQPGRACHLRHRRQFCPGDRDRTGAVLSFGHQGTEGPQASNLAGTAGELSVASTEARRRRRPWSNLISRSAASPLSWA